MPECLEKGRKIFEWEKRRAECQNQQGNLRRGVGVACFSYTSNTWPVGVEIAGARLLMNQDGTINVQSGATEIGQGADTVFSQMVAETVGVPVSDVRVISTQDTDVTPFDPGAFASRQSYVAAPALRSAALLLKEKIIAHAAVMLHQSAMNLTLIKGHIVLVERPEEPLMSLKDLAMDAFYHPERGGQLSAESSIKTTTNPPAFGCTFVDLTVDIALCKVTINRILNVHDSGHILNPLLAEGQVHGGMGMGIGWALFEEMIIDAKSGVVRNPNLLDYKMPTMPDLPQLESAFVEINEPQSAYGHKSLGEPPIIPVAAAIRNAVKMAIGLLGIFGATIAAGFITTLLAPLIGRLMPLFPPLVTGVVITSIGLSIIQVGIDWAAGGKGNPQYGNPVYLGISFAVLIFILLITRYAKGFMSNVAVLLGIVFGFLLSWMMNEVNLSGLHDASWFAIVTPMSFGMPIFDPVSILTMTAVLIIVFIESMGMFLALGEIVGRKLSSHDIIRGLRVDGVGTMIGGTFNSFPHTSFSQNVGLVSVTRVHSRWVCISSGIILILFGMVPKMAVLVASIPQFVLGGAGLVMFGMVLATGIRILSRCNYTTNRYNLYIVAISLGVGMTPTLSHDFFSKLPAVLQPLLHSGIMLATLSAVVLNVFFNGYQHHADLVKESVSDKDLKVRTVRMWLLMRKLKKNEHGE